MLLLSVRGVRNMWRFKIWMLSSINNSPLFASLRMFWSVLKGAQNLILLLPMKVPLHRRRPPNLGTLFWLGPVVSSAERGWVYSRLRMTVILLMGALLVVCLQPVAWLGFTHRNHNLLLLSSRWREVESFQLHLVGLVVPLVWMQVPCGRASLRVSSYRIGTLPIIASGNLSHSYLSIRHCKFIFPYLIQITRYLKFIREAISRWKESFKRISSGFIITLGRKWSASTNKSTRLV